MPSIKYPGLNDYIKQLNALSDKGYKICKKATYEGANIVANAVRDSIEAIPTISDAQAKANHVKGECNLLSYRQKKGLLDGLGLTGINMEDGSYVHTKLGFDGYNSIVTKKWPKGQPNALIARVLESGSSAMYKNPFMRFSVNVSKNGAIKAMQKVFDYEVEKIMK